MPLNTIGNALFTKTQQRVLTLLFRKPDKSFYTNEIVRLADMGRGTITRELAKLSSAGLLTVTRVGNQQHYQANNKCPIFRELTSIVRKTFGIVDALANALSPIEQKIALAFVYGSIAKGEDTSTSDIDLMLVGKDLPYSDIIELLMPAEESLQRDINHTILSTEEFRTRVDEKRSFLMRVLEQPKLMIKGEINDIGQPI
ncbi:MAG: putative nucleotidyltransferase [Flavobacteriales bacterium]|jgi:predicted nucleotidyltransferase